MFKRMVNAKTTEVDKKLVKTRKSCNNRRLAASRRASRICTSTSHFWTLFSESPLQDISALDPHIRLMVDVLLTMNEAFRVAGVEFPVALPQTKPTGD